MEKHVKAIYEREEQRQKKGQGARSEQLNQRIKDALKVLNQFNSEETEEGGDKTNPPKSEAPIYFSIKNIRLTAGVTRSVHAFVNLEKVKNGEIILFESDNPEIKVEPDSEIVKRRKGDRQKIDLQITCNLKHQRGEHSCPNACRAGRG